MPFLACARTTEAEASELRKMLLPFFLSLLNLALSVSGMSNVHHSFNLT